MIVVALHFPSGEIAEFQISRVPFTRIAASRNPQRYEEHAAEYKSHVRHGRAPEMHRTQKEPQDVP